MIPTGFEARPISPADTVEAAALINICEETFCEVKTDHMSEEGMLDWLGGYDLATSTTVIRDDAGELAAMGLLERRKETLDLDGYVAPGRTGLGLGTALVAWAEEQARDRGCTNVRVAHLAKDTAAERLLEERGYVYARSFYRMIADLEAPPEPVTWPDGCELSTLEPGGEAVYHELLEEAFAEHWGHVARPLDEWMTRMQREQFDPKLWFLVRAAGEPAAAAICSQSWGLGWIGVIGVRSAFRRRGLAQRLLLHAFRELYALGERRMGLGVDASNETGATRLYESVGMRVAWRADVRDSAPE